MPSKRLDRLLSETSGIAALMPKARRLLELRGILAELLPESLRRSCSLANYKQGIIVLFAANSAVAAKLRLLAPALSEELLHRGIEVTGLEVRVQLPGVESEATEKSAEIGAAASASLARLADSLPESDLKQVLARLAARGKEPPFKPRR